METALFLLQVKELYFFSFIKLDSDVISLEKKKKLSGLKKKLRDFSGGLVVNNPPSSTGDTGLTPGQGTRIPHALKRVSPGATIEETHLHGSEDPLHFNQSINTLFKFENHYFQLNMAGCTHTLICVSSN